MTNLEILKLPTNTKVRIKKGVECSPVWKKVCLLSWYDHKKEGRTEIDTDTGEIKIYYPFGINSANNGVCYFFPAEDYELVTNF